MPIVCERCVRLQSIFFLLRVSVSYLTEMSSLNFKQLPIGFCGSQFLIDCSSHFRKRVHPGQQLYYRGDVGCHQLTAQVVTDIRGIPIDVSIALGHNNDKGVFNLSGFRDQIEEENVSGLSLSYSIVLTL